MQHGQSPDARRWQNPVPLGPEDSTSLVFELECQFMPGQIIRSSVRSAVNHIGLLSTCCCQGAVPDLVVGNKRERQEDPATQLGPGQPAGVSSPGGEPPRTSAVQLRLWG